MKIIGFNFDKISAERKKELKGKLEIKTNMNIKNIEKGTLDIAGEVLKFSYDYSILYEPEFAEINFEGIILTIPNNKEDFKKILKNWKKKKIEESIRIFILNFIMSKCNLKALQLEDEFNFPPHIPLPRLSKQQNQQQGTTSPANYAG